MDTTALAQWCALGAVFIGAAVSVFRADNTALPFALSTKARASIALVLGALQACLMGIQGGVPWMQAVITAAISVVTGFAAHGAPRVLLVPLVLWFAMQVSACGLLNPKTAADAGNAVACIETHVLAGDSVAQVAVACGIEIVEVIDEVLASKKSEMLASNAHHEAARARAHILEDAARR